MLLAVGVTYGVRVLAARRSDLLKIYQCPGFPILTDRAGGSSSASGNDSEICWALTVLGKT